MTEHKVYLEIVDGPYKGQHFYFAERDTFTIGRASDCTLSIKEDASLSRHHLLIAINNSSVKARDLGSLNGTLVNGRLIYNSRNRTDAVVPPPEELQNGDCIETGGTTMVIHIGSPVEDMDWVG